MQLCMHVHVYIKATQAEDTPVAQAGAADLGKKAEAFAHAHLLAQCKSAVTTALVIVEIAYTRDAASAHAPSIEAMDDAMLQEEQSPVEHQASAYTYR